MYIRFRRRVHGKVRMGEIKYRDWAVLSKSNLGGIILKSNFICTALSISDATNSFAETHRFNTDNQEGKNSESLYSVTYGSAQCHGRSG